MLTKFMNTDNEFIVTGASRTASGELRMNLTKLVQLKLVQIGIVGSACAAMLFAADFWKTKDSSQWTDDEVSKVLSESPWAKAKTVQPEQTQQRRGMGRRGGGFGFPGGGLGGGGYPGGGGGYPGGGGGYPGGGGGYPQSGGGGYPSSGRNSGDPAQSEPMNLTVRWASAAPIQQALMRQGASASEELKAIAASTDKYYVISVLGLRLQRPLRSSTVDADDPNDNENSNGNDNNAPRGSSKQSNDALRSQLLDAAQLAPKGKSSIYAQDVQIAGPGGIDGVRFLFPRKNPINANDKEVEFILNIRRIKVDEKFKLSDMQYEGKLAL